MLFNGRHFENFKFTVFQSKTLNNWNLNKSRVVTKYFFWRPEAIIFQLNEMPVWGVWLTTSGGRPDWIGLVTRSCGSLNPSEKLISWGFSRKNSDDKTWETWRPKNKTFQSFWMTKIRKIPKFSKFQNFSPNLTKELKPYTGDKR